VIIGASNIYLEQSGLILPLPNGLMLENSSIEYIDQVVSISAVPEFESYFREYFDREI